MPPKKDAKKQAIAKPDNSGIPKQDIQFKFNLKIKTDAQQISYAVMIQWFGNTSDKIQRIDTPIIDTWAKGEEGSIIFEKECDIIRVDDDFCKNLCNRRFYVYFVNGETNKVQDTINIDYSSLIMEKGEEAKPTFSYSSETIRVMGIDSFQIKLTANKQLIQQVYRNYLNPFQVQVIGAKNVPIENSSKYQPAFIRYQFFDGTIAETHSVVGQSMLLWNHKHVFLAGLIQPAILKQRLRHGYMKFQLHDRDQIQNKKIKEDTPLYDLTRAIQIQQEKQKPVEEDPKKKGKKQPQKKQAKKDAKKDTKKKDMKLGQPILPEKVDTFQNNYGVSAFYLIDFLKPSMRTGKYKTPVVPRTTFQDYESRNIDLNTTARNQMQKIISSNNYFEQDTVIVAGFTLSCAIGSFVKPPPPEQPDQPVGKGKKQVKDAPPPVKQPIEQKSQPKDVYQRVIYVIPYKNPELIAKIDNLFHQTNMKTFNLKNKRQIATFLLKQQDKQNIKLDYFTGIQLIDNETRIYIIEGLRQGSMKKFHQFMVKNAPNSKSLKILKNSKLSYLKRLYNNFNIQLKRMRFRPSLTQLLLNPSIYIKSKVPQQISQNLNKINEIKKICDDLKSVDSMNLWPEATVIVQIQRKFSDSLSFEDINGFEQQNKRKKDKKLNQTDKQQKTINFMQSQDLQFVTAQNFTLPKISKSATPHQQFSKSVPDMKEHTKKFVQTKTFNKDEQKMLKSFNMQLKKGEIDPNQPVYIYGGQKNNWYEKKMRQMRQKICQEKGHTLFTYSKDHLGLSISPYEMEEQLKRQKKLQESQNISGDKFSSLIIKTHQERMKLPKRPGDQDIEDLKNHPYHEQKSREKQFGKNPRDMPMHSDKMQFQKYINKIEIFSVPQVVQGEKVTPAERFRLQQQQKKKQQQQSRKKMFGDPYIHIKKSYISDKATGVDRFKDILQDSPTKKGIIDIHKKTKTKRPNKQYQVSFMLNQDKNDPSFNPLIRRDNPMLNTNALEFNNYQQQQVLTRTGIAKPLKKGSALS